MNGDGACRETQVSQQFGCATSELECLETQVEHLHQALQQVISCGPAQLERATEVEPPQQELVPAADSIRSVAKRIQRQATRLETLRGQLEV